jgi:formylglycine-generating enzyme required for sulfatase activity
MDTLDTLKHLTQDQLSAVILRLDLHKDIAPDKVTHTERAVALATWAQGTVAHALRLNRALALEAPEAVSDLSDPDAWLRHEVDEARHLRVLGIRAGDGRFFLPMDQLFVEIDLKHEAPDRDLRCDPAGFKGPRDKAPEADLQLPDALRALAAEGATFNRRGLVLIGLPGSGKTTLLKRQLTLDAADPSGPRPLLLRFSTLQTHGLANLRPGGLVDWAEAEARIAGFPGAGRAVLANRNGRFRFLLDGYDELATPADRQAVARWLHKEIALWRQSDMVITTRKAAWDVGDQRHLRERFVPFVLLHLTEGAVRRYVQAWFPLVAGYEVGVAASPEQRARAQAAAQAAAQELLRWVQQGADADARSRIQAFLGNPLLLSIVCLVFRQRRTLPKQRGQLYSQCFEVLVRGREIVDGCDSGFEPETGIALLGPMAWEMQATTTDLASPKEIDRAAVLAHLSDARESDAAVRDRAPAALLQVLREECGLLVSPDGEGHAFAHLTFQEYLAFAHARGQRRAVELAGVAQDDRWREVILLGMSDKPFRVAFFEALLATPGRVAALAPLVRACRLESEPPVEPVVAMIERAVAAMKDLPPGASVGPTPGDLVGMLGLFTKSPPQALRLAASGLVDHPDETVSRLACELAGVERRAGPRRLTLKALGMEFVWVPAGEFLMGATRTPGAPGYDPEAEEDEGPPHRVTLREGFYMGRFPVTNAQFRRFVEATRAVTPGSFRRSGFDDPAMPVAGVSWDDAIAYCAWASKHLGLEITLPTEAEWEWAARGPDSWKFPWGAAEPTLDHAWYGGRDGDNNVVRGPSSVGGRPAGAGPFGAEEQAGNVWEWCYDAYARYPAQVHLGFGALHGRPIDTSHQQDDTLRRVTRGGTWGGPASWLRSASRFRFPSGTRLAVLGFRVVCRSPEPRS